MRSGPLRNRITVQKAVETQDSIGEPDVSWVEYLQAWASVEPITSREYFDANRQNGEITHKVRLRYRPGITHKMRVKYGARILDIESIIDARERHRSLELLCRENV